MFYHPLRALLFQLDPETAHNWTIKTLRALPTQPLGLCYGSRIPAAPRRVMGLDFPNPVGLVAAGASLVQLYTGYRIDLLRSGVGARSGDGVALKFRRCQFPFLLDFETGRLLRDYLVRHPYFFPGLMPQDC